MDTTTDGGRSWRRTDTLPLAVADVEATAGGRLLVLGSRGQVWRSEGSDWTSLRRSRNAPRLGHSLEATGDYIYSVDYTGRDKVWISPNNGRDWRATAIR